MSVIARDITLHKQREAQLRSTEQALRQSQVQMRHLAWRQQQRQEQERKQIAQEIHDELAQTLTILQMDLTWLIMRPEMTVDVQERLEEMSNLVDELGTIAHRIAMELRPPMLDDLGLLATLEWQLEEVHRRTGLAYTLHLPSQYTPIDINRTTALFRIFQEALTNVVRHAEAVCLEVWDNGKGMITEPPVLQGVLGLLGMRERAEIWGGTVCISGRPGSGTTITVRIPYGSEAAPEDVP